MKPVFHEEEEEVAEKKKKAEEKREKKLEKKRFENPEPAEEVEARQKARATEAIANLPPNTLLMYTDGGHRPLQEAVLWPDKSVKTPAVTEEAAGWGAVVWYRVDPDRGIDERPQVFLRCQRCQCTALKSPH
jgi:hypothetical protein